MWKGYEIQILVSTNDMLLEHSHALWFTSCLGLPSCYNSSLD